MSFPREESFKLLLSITMYADEITNNSIMIINDCYRSVMISQGINHVKFIGFKLTVFDYRRN